MSNSKTLFVLIGPKGSGKTHVGTLVNQHTDIVFLRVEPIWLSLNPDEDGWKKVEAVVDAIFQKRNKVMIESLGIGEGFGKFHESLARKYSMQSRTWKLLMQFNPSTALKLIERKKRRGKRHVDWTFSHRFGSQENATISRFWVGVLYGTLP